MPKELEADRNSCQLACPGPRQRFLPRLPAGMLVMARDTPWRVISSVPHQDCVEIRLRNGAGERVLLWPFDRVQPIRDNRRAAFVSKRRWARGIAAAVRDVRSPASLLVTSTAADILCHQLDPALAMAGGASRLLLADEVGLGKTVQAGWIIADLLARERDARVLVCVPAGLRTQWGDELGRFFCIESSLADARWLRRRITSLPADVNPWCLPGVYLASMDFIKRRDVIASLADDAWDLVVVDEAHGAAAPTERHAALSVIARKARRVVLVTATPFSGDAAAFHSLNALGAADHEPLPMFRRSREDVGAARRRSHRFMVVRLDPAETRLQRELERYTAEVWRASDAGAPRLAMTILRKRALSSPAALARSLRRRASLLASPAPQPRQLTLFEGDGDEADEEPSTLLGAPGLDDADRERRWLDALVTLAEAATSLDSKRRFLSRLLARLAGKTSAIVFTEYRDTLRDLAGGHPAALQIHGGLAREERDAVQRTFNAEGGLLLATDAAAEGLNLQQHCRLVINYELPWNPGRLEQRIGRVDRIGQARAVHAISLVARDTAEDLVVANILRRLERIARHLGTHDRLVAFLDDARIAQGVIGGGAIEPDPSEWPALASPITTMSAAARAAREHLETIRRLSADDAQRDAHRIVVCRLRQGRVIPPGALFVIEWRALLRDGHAVAADVIPVHVAPSLDPRTLPVLQAIAAAARERAATLLAHARLESEHVCAALAERERQVAALVAVVPAQPGLFEGTASMDASRRQAAERQERHRYRLARLAEAADVRSDLRVAGLLLVGPS